MENDKKQIRKIIIFSLIFAIICTFTSCDKLTGKKLPMEQDKKIAEKQDDKAEMEKDLADYLGKKYNEDFSVERLEYYSNEAGEAGYRFKVTLKRRSAVTWILNNRVYDGFPKALWSKDAEEDIQPLMHELYGPDVIFRVIVDVPSNIYKQLKGSNMPSYKEAMKIYEKEMEQEPTYNHNVDIFLFKDVNKQEEAGKILKLIKYLQQKDIKDPYLSISYYTPEFKDNATGIIREKGISGFLEKYHSGPSGAGKKLLNHFSVGTKKKVDLVKNESDILSYFTK